MSQIFDEYLKNKQKDGLSISIMDVECSFNLTPEKLKEKNYEMQAMRSKFDLENKLTIIESIFSHNSGFLIYLLKNDDKYDVKILHLSKHLDEIILFLTNLNRYEKHRPRPTQ